MIKTSEAFSGNLKNPILEEKGNRIIFMIYLWLEGILFFLIKWTETFRPFSVYGKVEYSAIVLNFAVMAYFYLIKQKRNYTYIEKGGDIVDWKIPLALTLTLLADYFLTLTGTHFSLGVFCFFLVQSVYGWYIGYQKRDVLLRILLFFCFAGVMILLGMTLSFAFFCGLSIAALTGNVYGSFRRFRCTLKKADKILFFGLLLFAGCDLNLGLSLITDPMQDLSTLHFLTRQMVWICYVPSQVLLTIVSIFGKRD